MNIVTNSAGLIVMMSDGSPTPPEGGQLYELSQEQEAQLSAILSQPHGDVTFDGSSFAVGPAVEYLPPAACTNVQLRLELAAMNKYEQAKALAAQSGLEASIAFEYTAEFKSDNALLLSLAPALGIPADQVRDVIVRASKRVVGQP